MNIPTLWNKYTREEAQAAFLPGSSFKRGSWGMSGIVRLQNPTTQGFVLFVNLEQHYTDKFEESIDSNGVLTWQSQPSQTLSSSIVQELIHHQESNTPVYLFLQTKKTGAKGLYTYMGELSYLAHDANREKPVHFKWALQVLPSKETLKNIPLELSPSDQITTNTEVNIPIGKLQISSQPQSKGAASSNPLETSKFKAFKRNYEQIEANNRNLGLAGERLVVEHEKRLLIDAGKPELAQKVEHVSLTRGDGLGYDILSFTPSGDRLLIEVKTTTGDRDSPFYISPNELNCSHCNASRYKLVRIHDFNIQTGNGQAYELYGNLNKLLLLKATQFQARLK